MKTHAEYNELFHYIIRVSKKDSAFTYFTLEANEGVCFYSTLDESLGTQYRDLDLKGTIEYSASIQKILTHLKTQLPVEILKHEIIQDL